MGRHSQTLVLLDVMGSLLESRVAMALFRLYITGDTLVIDDLREIPRRYPEINLALLHLGGTYVLGSLVTMAGKQGVQLMRIVASQHAIPIHYNDYDVFTSPLVDF
jgi:L-ascorbate metabolism protein UlaG (beta-lactamase superfamily)